MTWLRLTAAFGLVLVNGFFVAAEFALVKVRGTHIETLARQGSKRGKLVRQMIDHLDAYLSACQLGITLASLALGWIGEPVFEHVFEPLLAWAGVTSELARQTVSATLGFSIITILHIVIGELAPKTLAIQQPGPTSLWIAYPMHGFYRAAYPAIWLLNKMSNATLRLFGLNPLMEGESHSEEELRVMLAESVLGGTLPLESRRLIERVFDFSRRRARHVLLPRQDVVVLSTKLSFEENIAIARASGHTRFPLVEGDLDHAVGMVHIKDLFRTENPPQGMVDLVMLRREALFVPGSISLQQLVREFRGKRTHMAIVLDEFGGASGITTLENVIEELLGSIQDEFDSDVPELTRAADGGFRVHGGAPLSLVERRCGIAFGEREDNTIGGLVLTELGRRPQRGDRVKLENAEIEILEVDRFRVLWVGLRTIDTGIAEASSP